MRHSRIDRTASEPARVQEPHLDERLDEALAQSYPAGDLVSIVIDRRARGDLS